MPQERKKRGRREEAKQKREDGQDEVYEQSKDDVEAPDEAQTHGDHIHEHQHYEFRTHESDSVNQGAFFGLLDDQELAYFASLDTLITSNQFEGDDEKDVFINNTFAEIQGQELKIATSPSSRFLEKLIFLLRKDQLVAISTSLIPHLFDLIHRPSASFCCEALILRLGQESITAQYQANDDESLGLLQAIGDQLSTDVVEIMSHAFASHVLRVFLLVLTGSSISQESKISFLHNKRKDDNVNYEKAITILKDISTSSPTAFHKPLHALITKLVENIDTSTAQKLALSPISGPVLQIIVEYELATQKKQDSQSSASLLSLVLPNEDVEGESLHFLQILLEDSVGSHLMEILVVKSPGRIFKRLHRSLFDGKLLQIAQRKTTATYVLVKGLERFSSGNLEKAAQELAPGLRGLVQDANTSVVDSLIDQCRRRQVDVRPISEAFRTSFGNGLVKDVLEGSHKDDTVGDIPVHVSVMMQTMLAASDGLRTLMLDGISNLSQNEIVNMSKQRSASRVIQAALHIDQPSLSRKQLISNFLGKIAELGQHNIASHVIDVLWTGSTGLKFLRDQLINEVLVNEQVLRQTIAGRAVCRNWRKWSREIGPEERPMTGIDKARKRHAMAALDNRKKPRLD